MRRTVTVKGWGHSKGRWVTVMATKEYSNKNNRDIKYKERIKYDKKRGTYALNEKEIKSKS